MTRAAPNTQDQATLENTVIALFPGQGSQHVGMGKDFYDNYSLVREIFEEASDAIHVDLKKLCFQGPDSDLVLTENTQPCLLVTSVSAFRVAQYEFGFSPSAAAGHSLGEYSALVAIGSLKLPLATLWVRERGAAMQRAVPTGHGTMAAVLGLEDSIVESLCRNATLQAQEKRNQQGIRSEIETLVQPANFNAPGQVVIAGSNDAVSEVMSLIKTDSNYSKGKIIPLQVSAPFHSRLMRPARDRMAGLFSTALEQEKPQLPTCPYVPNRTARLTQEPGLVFEHLVDQVDHPVLWRQSMESLLEFGYSKYVEFGPGKVLSGLMKRISGQVQKTCSFTSVGDCASLKNLETFLSPSP